MTVQDAEAVYSLLKKELGLSRAQVRKILPTWWSPDAEKHPDGVAELCFLVSRRLSLDLGALLQGEIRQKESVMRTGRKLKPPAAC